MGRPLRIAFVAYRGNMQCGGQGIYLWFLARELARLGHRVDVIVGPPYPDPMPFAGSVTPLPNEHVLGKLVPARLAALLLEGPALPGCSSRSTSTSWRPSRLGFLPEPFAFSLRASSARWRSACARALATT